MMHPNEDMALLRAIVSGKEWALKVIYDRYSNRVYKLSFVLLKDTGWSEDIVQEVFIKFWDSRERLDLNGDVWRLLYVITKRASLNKIRDVGRSNVDLERMWQNVSCLAESVHEVFIAKELNAHLGKLLEQLPVRQREVLKLSREQGFTHQQIATQLGVSPNTVKNHLVQALKRIRKFT